MEEMQINKNYLLLKNWWETIDLTNYEKNLFNKEIILSKLLFLFNNFPNIILIILSIWDHLKTEINLLESKLKHIS